MCVYGSVFVYMALYLFIWLCNCVYGSFGSVFVYMILCLCLWLFICVHGSLFVSKAQLLLWLCLWVHGSVLVYSYIFVSMSLAPYLCVQICIYVDCIWICLCIELPIFVDIALSMTMFWSMAPY